MVKLGTLYHDTCRIRPAFHTRNDGECLKQTSEYLCLRESRSDFLLRERKSFEPEPPRADHYGVDRATSRNDLVFVSHEPGRGRLELYGVVAAPASKASKGGVVSFVGRPPP